MSWGLFDLTRFKKPSNEILRTDVDIFLEDANGFDVIATMREKVPDLPVVAISGMTLLDTASHSSVVCLQKPFRPNDLIGAIEAVLPR